MWTGGRGKEKAAWVNKRGLLELSNCMYAQMHYIYIYDIYIYHMLIYMVDIDGIPFMFVCFSGCSHCSSSALRTSHRSPTVTRWPSAGACQGLCGLHKAVQRFPFPGALRSSSLASAHRVYVLCNCRPQSEQEASVCQNRHVLPSSEA